VVGNAGAGRRRTSAGQGRGALLRGTGCYSRVKDQSSFPATGEVKGVRGDRCDRNPSPQGNKSSPEDLLSTERIFRRRSRLLRKGVTAREVGELPKNPIERLHKLKIAFVRDTPSRKNRV